MPFQFSLQALLRVRSGYERLERLRLLAITAMSNRMLSEISSVDAMASESRHQIKAVLQAGMAGGELHFALAAERTRASLRRLLADRLNQFEAQREKQRKIFEKARQKREIIENLRSRRWEEYKRVQLRREQNLADELHLLRLSSSLRETPDE